MLPRHERRRLEEIEDQLSIEDPEFARALTDPSLRRWSPRRVPPRLVLGLLSALLAVLCLFLGEGGAFVSAGILAVVLIAVRDWSFRTA
ncbi:Protein of unknown function (DUF3040) [Saccharopolyspora erythraea NRRL 2338]|uniref:Uncharacterized protein n=2 Tax=Saccharopolyspora erythraea TaxID=1836 RepID=A4FF32_SACEN|nr:DUF3040 domain-containing protein [Saccharopolyspora erythraea]EQD81583.1 hypothetical protein N599_35375 [Saccharopolyspora erythraea D]PFG96382.1 Protein of unknown function (DUF3040) [Saccharopolyspora erythraea NRRL 2338]QRK92888.1 DUF3040 domain-containing protein [Saccharopolyspora erythraea]CAM02657.1 hypothetical protein SACE_3382 [Saccharopolyspora erythraea NRRL 2338]